MKCNYCNTEISKFTGRKRHEDACYMKLQNYCVCCGDLITRNGKPNAKDSKKYCSQSCSAKITNANREVTWGEKTRKSVNEFYDKDPRYRIRDWKDYKGYRKKVDRYSIQQLKEFKPELYEYWKSNPYTGSGDTSKLSLEHKKMIVEFYDEGLSVEEAGDISNLEIIPYRQNNLNSKKSLTFRN